MVGGWGCRGNLTLLLHRAAAYGTWHQAVVSSSVGDYWERGAVMMPRWGRRLGPPHRHVLFHWCGPWGTMGMSSGDNDRPHLLLLLLLLLLPLCVCVCVCV